MSAALDALTRHYERQRAQTYTVPEVETEDGPLVIHFDPPTARDMARVRHRAGNSDAKLSLFTVMLLSKDADGKPLFADNPATEVALRQSVNATVLGNIAKAIMGIRDPAPGDAGDDAEDDLGN